MVPVGVGGPGGVEAAAAEGQDLVTQAGKAQAPALGVVDRSPDGEGTKKTATYSRAKGKLRKGPTLVRKSARNKGAGVGGTALEKAQRLAKEKNLEEADVARRMKVRSRLLVLCQTRICRVCLRIVVWFSRLAVGRRARRSLFFGPRKRPKQSSRPRRLVLSRRSVARQLGKLSRCHRQGGLGTLRRWRSVARPTERGLLSGGGQLLGRRGPPHLEVSRSPSGHLGLCCRPGRGNLSVWGPNERPYLQYPGLRG
jgi:hypothetical protein